MVYAAPLEPFFIQVKLSVIIGIMLVLPILFHQLWLFVAPGLFRHERRVVIPFVVGSAVAFLTGAVFFLFILWPAVVNFSLSYANEYLDPLLNLSAYVNFALRLVLIFELPVASFVLARAGLIRAEFLARFRRFAILGSAIVGAFHSDLMTMALIAIPLYLMYELSIWVARIFGRRRPAVATAAPAKA